MYIQVRVVMNKEPKHFMKMFGGRLVIFKVETISIQLLTITCNTNRVI